MSSKSTLIQLQGFLIVVKLSSTCLDAIMLIIYHFTPHTNYGNETTRIFMFSVETTKQFDNKYTSASTKDKINEEWTVIIVIGLRVVTVANKLIYEPLILPATKQSVISISPKHNDPTNNIIWSKLYFSGINTDNKDRCQENLYLDCV